jgi:hypothetical protein
MTLFPAQVLNAHLCSVFVRLESFQHALDGSWHNLDEELLSAMHVAALGGREEEVQRDQRAEEGSRAATQQGTRKSFSVHLDPGRRSNQRRALRLV